MKKEILKFTKEEKRDARDFLKSEGGAFITYQDIKKTILTFRKVKSDQKIK